jgi:hypothetical protein
MIKEIEKIKERNERVEIDKSWEVSKTRRILIGGFTYFVVVGWMMLTNLPDPWINSAVPAGAFILSTLTLPFIKKFWVKNIRR